MNLSIITPTYNSAGTLADTLKSVQSQTYTEVEHLIIDGGSQDETIAIARRHGERVCRVVSEPDDGLYDAMNKGIALASGEVIGILNSDDFYAGPQVLERVMNVFRQNEVDSVYGDLKYVHAGDTSKVVRSWRAGGYQVHNWLHGWMPPHPTFFVRSEVYERYGCFDTSFRSAADYELMLRFLYKHRISTAYIPKVLVHMRTGGQSNASFRHRWLANREDHRAWKRNGLRPWPHTTWVKPIRKLGQFILR